MSKDYQKYADRYKRGGCTIEQLNRLCELGVLTEDEVEEIIKSKSSTT